jgi:hypothetical protein
MRRDIEHTFGQPAVYALWIALPISSAWVSYDYLKAEEKVIISRPSF